MAERRTIALVGGALVIVVVVAIVAFVGAGDSSSEDLSSPAGKRFVARADRICASGRTAAAKVETRFPEGDRSAVMPLIGYAGYRLEVSTATFEQLDGLRPPDGVRSDYEKYVDTQRFIYYDDLTATHAAHSVHPGEYLAARKRQRRERQEGYELAGEIGLDECALP